MGRALSSLSPGTRWLGRRVEIYRCVDSTNRIAEDLAAEGAPEGTLVLADEQTAGRGRLGRTFFSPAEGGLYLSVLLRPTLPPEAVHRYVFAAAVAVARTIRACMPPERSVAIKWPNDVLLEAKKVCGINLPVKLDGGRVSAAILGVGVNVNVPAGEFPLDIRDTATSLCIHAGRDLDRVGFAEAVIEAIEREIDALHQEGFAPVLEAWGKFFRMQGARVRVGGPGVPQEFEGTVEGVDGEGALLLRTDRGLVKVVAGDVTLLRDGR